jgi:hypothetical protein
MNDQNDEQVSDSEWLLVNAIRNTFGIGYKSAITYGHAAQLAKQIAPQLFMENSPLLKAYESEGLQLYKDRANAQSKLKKKVVKPSQVLSAEIKRLELDLQSAELDKGDSIEKEIARLEKLREISEESSWTESQAINRDASIPESKLPISKKGQGYKEFTLNEDRKLRIRVFHPDPIEARIGVDLIYENYYEQKNKSSKSTLLVRIVALQYKMWNGTALYTSQTPNLIPQLNKMRDAFCNSGFCEKPKKIDVDERYRFPYCCGFLRPTDRRQTKNAWQVTHAWQIPICEVIRKLEPHGQDNQILRSNRICNSAITQDVFQDLFNRGMLGSRWLDAKILEKFYSNLGIFSDYDRVVIHAQEY